MIRLLIPQSKYLFFVCLIAMTFSFTINVASQNVLSSVSGKVIDAEGEPVAGITLALKPLKVDINRYEYESTIPFLMWPRVVTGRDGSFSFNNIEPIRSQFVMFPEYGSEHELISITLGDLVFYSIAFRRSMPTSFGKLMFSIEPGEHLDNMIVNVKTPRMRIRGRVLFEDGTPLVNEEINLTIRYRSYTTAATGSGSSGGAMSRVFETDNEGYFVTYSNDRGAEHTVSMTYKGFSAESDLIILEDGERYDDLVFVLKNIERMKAREAIWVVNPSNGHAYKKIQCSSWEDSKAKAEAENAYLVAINDKAEQDWLNGVFRENSFFWIGLVVQGDDTSWQWEDGSSLTYTNWFAGQEPKNELEGVKKIPVAMDFAHKKWLVIDQNSLLLSSVKQAILEKEGLTVPKPVPKRGPEQQK